MKNKDKKDKSNSFYYKKDRLNQLRGFCAFVQSKCSTIKASKMLGMEQPAISKQINALERDLGVKLFDRTRYKRLQLTAIGNRLYERAYKIVNQTDTLYEEFSSDMENEWFKTIKIAGHYSFLCKVLPKILGNMLKLEEFKDLNVTILNISKDEAIQKLVNKEIDLGFYLSDPQDEKPVEIETEKILKCKNILIFNKDNPLAKKENITKEDVENSNFLSRSENSKFTAKVSAYFNLKTNNQLKIEKTTSEIAVEMVKHTNTTTIIPEIFLRNSNLLSSTDLEWRSLEHLMPNSHFYIIKLKNSILKPSLEFIINEIKKIG